MIEWVEVSPRDGLQNEKVVLSTPHKVELIAKAVDAGARRIEVASFVNPRLVPQMADAEAVLAALPRRDEVTYVGLVLNERGAERALQTAVDELGIVCAASDTFGQKNQGMSCGETLSMAERVLARAAGSGRRAQVTISVAFGCPFEQRVEPDRVVAMARRLAGSSTREVALADTIGVARPGEVERLVKRVVDAISPLPVRVHFHDTHGMGVANAFAAVRAGASVVDASIGGAGGCPFAPGAAGNVASEDIAYAFADDIDANLDRLLAGAFWLNERLGRAQLSAQMRAALARNGDGNAANT